MDVELTPTQRKVLDGILGPDAPRPPYDPALAERLRRTLEDAFASIRSERPIVVGKYQLDEALRCEGLYASSAARAFVWTVPMLRGRVAHRAIEIAVGGGPAAAPLDVIDRSVDALVGGEEGDSVASFLAGLDPLDMARLKSEANEAVVGFLADWPPIDRRWLPRVEERARVMVTPSVKLQGKYDLAFGRPQKGQARVIIVDFKTGDRRPGHVDDLRFYALIETLRRGVPPFRVATYYTQESDFFVEDTTAETLEAATRRTIDGVRAMVHARDEEPVLRPSTHCRWCGRKEDCAPGSAWLSGPRGIDEDPGP